MQIEDLGNILLETVEHAVFVLEPDAQGRVVYADISEYGARVVDRTRADFIGKTAPEIYQHELGQLAYEHHLNCLRTRKAFAYEILLNLGEDHRLIRTTLRPVLNASGCVKQIIGSSIDLSNGQPFQAAENDLDQLREEMEQFISMAAHDLRSPMLQVSQIAAFLREDLGDSAGSTLPLIEMLEQVGEKTLRLIGDVLNHAQNASLAPTKAEFDFGALVDDIGGSLDPMDKARITPTRARVRGDFNATQVILRNLVDNALKHGPAGSATKSTIDVDLKPRSPGYYEVTVSDNGPGIDDPTKLLSAGQKSKAQSGFGLMGIRRLIHARGGSFTVTNRTDQTGAMITFALPGEVLPACEPTRSTAEVAQPGLH